MSKHFQANTQYSEPVQEIMGSVPSWIIKWGISVITALFIVIIIGCCFIKFPQTIPSAISIISANPPSMLEAKYAGIIDTIAVKNGQFVKQGELIALLKTPAVYEDMKTVESFAYSARFSSLSDIAYNSIFQRTLKLGDLQDKWTELCSLSREYQLYCSLDQIGKKRNLLSGQIQQNKEYYNTLCNQRILLEKDVKLQELSMRRDSVLWSEGLTAQAEFETSQQNYLSKLKSLVSFDASLKMAELNTLTLEQGLNELFIQNQAEEDEFNLKCSRTISELMARIAEWTEMYAIVAPFDGVVALQDYWGVGQSVSIGDTMASVVPSTEIIVEGRMEVSSVGFGRIAEGQTVNVRLNGFPYIEFGILKGVISRISQVPKKSLDGSVVYNVDVAFPAGLVSTYHKRFPFIQDMDGEAEIITQDKRLIDYFVDPLVSLFRNR